MFSNFIAKDHGLLGYHPEKRVLYTDGETREDGKLGTKLHTNHTLPYSIYLAPHTFIYWQKMSSYLDYYLDFI